MVLKLNGLKTIKARQKLSGFLFMVGIAGLEPATSRPPDARATRLRYTPIFILTQRLLLKLKGILMILLVIAMTIRCNTLIHRLSAY